MASAKKVQMTVLHNHIKLQGGVGTTPNQNFVITLILLFYPQCMCVCVCARTCVCMMTNHVSLPLAQDTMTRRIKHQSGAEDDLVSISVPLLISNIALSHQHYLLPQFFLTVK